MVSWPYLHLSVSIPNCAPYSIVIAISRLPPPELLLLTPCNTGSVSEVTQLLSNLLRNWSYLEPLFMGSEEVQKELPIEANRFAEVDMEVRDILKVILYMSGCVCVLDRM